MTSDIRRLIINTRERFLSDDWNTATDLIARQNINSIVAVATPDFSGPSVDFYGVLSGLLVTATGTTLTVQIEQGSAVLYDPAAAGLYDSEYRWIEVGSPIAVDLSSFVSPGLPRWVCIEITPGDEVESSSLRDIFNPLTNTFVPQTVPKIRRSAPVATVTAGAPSATPVLPLGTPGRIPLAYVYIPGGALAIPTGNLIYCRPVFSPRLGDSAPNRIGGGIDVPAPNGGDVLTPRPVRVGFGFTAFEVAIATLSAPIDLAAAGSPIFAFGEAYPPTGPNALPVYLYAMTAPYPAGYDTNLAPREFLPSNPLVAETLIPSYTAGMGNGIVVASYTPPFPLDGPIPTNIALVSGAINDPFWNGGPGAGAPTQIRVAYIGAATYWFGTINGLLGQHTLDGHTVRFPDDPPMSGFDTRINSTALLVPGNYGFEDPMFLSGGRWSPLTANHYSAYYVTQYNGAITSGVGVFTEVSDRAASSTNTPRVFRVDKSMLLDESVVFSALHHTVDGQFSWTHQNLAFSPPTNTSTLTIVVCGYVDSGLARV